LRSLLSGFRVTYQKHSPSNPSDPSTEEKWAPPWSAVVAWSSLLVAMCNGCGGPQKRCATDVDCGSNRICDAKTGACVLPAGMPDVIDAQARSPQRSTVVVKGSPPFAMFGGDATHSGRRAGPAPQKLPAEVWSVSVGGVVAGSPTVGPDGTIYVVSHDGALYAVTPEGKIRWRFAMGERSWSTPAVAADGTVYVGSDDDYVYAVDKSGKQKWKFRIGDCAVNGFGPESSRCDADGGPTIGPDGTIYIGGDGVHALWPDGTLRWKFATAEHVLSTPALGADGTVYVGCQDSAVYAIASDGTKRWDYRTGGDVDASPTIAPDGTIYAGSDDNALYALTSGGKMKWKTLTGDDIRGAAALGADGTIYVGSYDRSLYAIAPNGQVRWKLSAADKIHGAPAIATDGAILFGSQDTHLYAVDANGTLRWVWQAAQGAGDIDTTPAIGRDGTVYVAGDDQKLRALR
jgi:outer membrane protein assembly factor BamB